MHAILKKDKISVVIRVLLTDRGQKAFSSRKDKQSRFLNDLCFALNQQIPEFQINYSKHNEFNGVQITKHIWSEALTKTSFFDSVLAVIHSASIFGIKEEQLILNYTSER